MGWREDFVVSKCQIAQILSQGGLTGNGKKSSYSEGVLIACATISALSREMWPGKKRDQARFNQALIVCPNTQNEAKKISIPLLRQFLLMEDKTKPANSIFQRRADQLESIFMPGIQSSQVIGDEYDQPESNIFGLSTFTGIPKNEIRKFSYSNLLYVELRCGYSHGYDAGEQAVGVPMFPQKSLVSYDNWQQKRLIHFKMELITMLATKLAQYCDAQDLAGVVNPLAVPAPWWIDEI